MTDQERFENEVNDALKDSKYRDLKEEINVIKICETPQILIDCGMKKLPIVYRKKHLRNAIKPYDKKIHHHGLSIAQIKEIPQRLASPAIIMKNKEKNKQNCPIVVFDDVVKDNRNKNIPIFVAIEMNEINMYEFKEIQTNKILSIHGRKNFDNYFKEVIENNGLIFYDKEKVHNLDCLCGLQSSTWCIKYEPNKILQQINENVNSKSEIKDLIEDLKNIDKNSMVLDGTSAKAEEAVQKNIKDKDKKDLETSKGIKKERIKNKENEIGE